MSYCLNQNCQHLQNPDGIELCQSCGSRLQLQHRYRAIKPIGQGGFGRTFLAVDEGVPSKPRCTIKQFFLQNQGTSNSQKAAELFRQEAVRLGELGKHPQIPQLLAYFEQDGQQYLVQEFIDGQNLARTLAEEGAFNESQIRELLECLLPVLKFVHEHQVIHRDIKPANIIRRSADHEIVLVDFGAAKFATGTALAKTGTTIGSAEYIAPEQARGKAIFASDLYSLGVTCIHLLTELPPFDLFDSYEDAWVWRDYLRTPVSNQLAYILDKLLQSATKRRYQSAAEVLKDLHYQSITKAGKSINSFDNSASQVPVVVSQTDTSPVTPRRKPGQSLTTGQILGMLGLPVDISKKEPETLWLPRLESSFLRGLVGIGIFFVLPALLASLHLASLPKQISTNSRAPSASPVTENPTPKFSEAVQPIRTLRTSESVLSVAFSRYGQFLVTGSDDIRALYPLNGRSNGQYPAIGNRESKIRVWSLRTGKLLHTLSTRYPVWSVAITPDNQTLVSNGSNVSADNKILKPDNYSDRGSIQLWNLRTGNLIRTLPKSANDTVLSRMFMAISPDEQSLATGSIKGVELWNLQTGQLIDTLPTQSTCITYVAISPDGQTLASVSDVGVIELWNLRTGSFIRTLDNSKPGLGSMELRTLAITPDGQTLVSGSSFAHEINVWNLHTGELTRTLKLPNNPPYKEARDNAVLSLAISPDGKTLASGSGFSKEGTISIWNLETGELMRVLNGHSRRVTSVSFSPDGKTLVSGSIDKTIKFWQVSP